MISFFIKKGFFGPVGEIITNEIQHEYRSEVNR